MKNDESKNILECRLVLNKHSPDDEIVRRKVSRKRIWSEVWRQLLSNIFQ